VSTCANKGFQTHRTLSRIENPSASISTFTLEILDLVTEPEWPNPFTDDAVSYWVEFAGLLAAFAEQLSKPLRSRDDPTDYIPSQKLADLIQTARVHGIRYPSAMVPSGTNVGARDMKIWCLSENYFAKITKQGGVGRH
jgi:hypothetical protein